MKEPILELGRVAINWLTGFACEEKEKLGESLEPAGLSP